MARLVSLKNQKNLWGLSSTQDANTSLEPQRTDLFLVDLLSASTGVQAATGDLVKIGAVYPQLVRSVSMPEQKLKAEVIRRNSIPYNTPSWDEPVDPVKITFLVPTYNTDTSPIIDLLDTWIALARAGRGDRTRGFDEIQTNFYLDQNYQIKCQFDIKIDLLRGRQITFDRAAYINNNIANLATATPTGILTAIQAQTQILANEPDLVCHSSWVAKNCWCGGYKISDLAHDDVKLLTAEATFYPDALERGTP